MTRTREYVTDEMIDAARLQVELDKADGIASDAETRQIADLEFHTAAGEVMVQAKSYPSGQRLGTLSDDRNQWVLDSLREGYHLGFVKATPEGKIVVALNVGSQSDAPDDLEEALIAVIEDRIEDRSQTR